MAKPSVRKKLRRNRPLEFFETLSPAIVPMAPALGKAHLDLQRYAVYLIWAGAAIAAGFGIGLLIVGSRAPTTPTEVPSPVATSSVRMTSSLTAPSSIALSTVGTMTQSVLSTSGALAVDQAQSGSPFAVVAVSVYQPAIQADSLQPGYQQYGQIQGSGGTAAVP